MDKQCKIISFLNSTTKKKDFVLVFDRPKSGRMIFNKESDAGNFLKFIEDKLFLVFFSFYPFKSAFSQEKKLTAYVEPENIFLTFLQNAQESKKLRL